MKIRKKGGGKNKENGSRVVSASAGKPVLASKYLLYLLWMAGCVFLAFLLSKIEEGVFYSGDGGLKYLMVRQFSEGDLSVYLHRAAPDWISDLWRSGMYHFSPPWVYDTAGGHLIAYPLFFVLLSTPFYLLAGFKGLYLIPAVALVLLWVRFAAVAKLLDTKPVNTFLASAALVFASPLTLYGAAFWEHTAAALTVFFAVEFAVRAHLGECSVKRAILLGAAAGIATWFRPEALPIVALIGLFSAAMFFKNRMRATFWFLGAAGFFILVFFVANWILYGHILGAHSFQIASDDLTMGERFSAAWKILVDMAKELAEYFPLVGAFILALPLLFISKRQILPIGLAAVIIVFLAAVPFVLPNSGGRQWGPRYLLAIVPIIALIGARQLESLKERAVYIKAPYLLAFLAALAIGGYKNTYKGAEHLSQSYSERITPAISKLKEDRVEYAVTTGQWIALELSSLNREVAMFEIKKNRELARFAQSLEEHGVRRFAYLTHPRFSAPPKEFSIRTRTGKRATVRLKYEGVFGIIKFFEGTIESE